MTSKSQPEQVKFLTADDARIESNQKPMIFGLFAGDIIGINMTKDYPEPTEKKPIVLQSLAIVISFLDCKSNFKVKMQLYKPDGTLLIEDDQINEIKPNKSQERSDVSIIAKFMPFPVTQLGEYKFVIKLGRKKYEHKFTFVRKIIP